MKVAVIVVALFAAWTLTAAEKMNFIHDITVKDIQGKDVSLGAYKGRVLLIVNVASECGYTGQYAGLEALYRKFKDKGLVVLGVPCNQFGGQEPGNETAILKFCQSNYGVTFPLTSKIEITGPGQHALYAALTGKSSPFPGPVSWNFGKFLVGRDGQILKRFEADAEPESGEVTGAIESTLATK